MIVGTQSNAPLTEEDLRLFRVAGFDSYKAMHHADPQEIRALRDAGADHIIVRLPDSRQPDGTFPSPEAYATACLAVIQKFVAAGVVEYQVDNEPNWLWTHLDYGPWQYVWWLRRVMQHLRANIPTGVRLICPPLSFAPALWIHGANNPTAHTLDDWLAAYSHTSAGELPSLYRLFDAVSAHPYWQSERQMTDPSFGGCFMVMHERSGGMPVVCLEWGNSLCQKQPAPPMSEVHAAMEVQYPQWLRWVGEFDYVEGTYLFLLGGTPDWAGFALTEGVARAIRRVTRPNERLQERGLRPI